jgi:hypothetical protein
VPAAWLRPSRPAIDSDQIGAPLGDWQILSGTRHGDGEKSYADLVADTGPLGATLTASPSFPADPTGDMRRP